MSKTEYTPGAVRAAKKINIFFKYKTHRPVLTNDEIVESMVATIIDKETATLELLEALERAEATLTVCWKRESDQYSAKAIVNTLKVISSAKIKAGEVK